MSARSIAKIDATQKSRLAKAGLRMFFNLANLWDLTQEDQLLLLGLSSRTTLNNWRKKALNDEDIRLSVDSLERLSLIVGIRKGVELLYPHDRLNSYMKSPNREFGGRSMIDVMLEGSIRSLYQVRTYLDASRGSHFG